MSELRQKMIRTMELENLSANSQRRYLAAVTGIANHYCQSPDQLTKKMIEDYLLYLKNDKGRAPTAAPAIVVPLFTFSPVPFALALCTTTGLLPILQAWMGYKPAFAYPARTLASVTPAHRFLSYQGFKKTILRIIS